MRNLLHALVAGSLGCTLLLSELLAQGGFTGPGRYEITNLKSGKVIDLDRNDQTTVIQFSSRGTDNQTWEIQPAREGHYYLRNGMNGYALEAPGRRNSVPVRAVPFNGGESQQWRFEPGKDGNALIVSRLGKTLDIPDGTSRDGVRVQIYDVNGDSNQRFIFRRVSGYRAGDGDRDRDDRDRDDRDRDDRGEPRSIRCSSDNGERVYCEVDTRERRVRLVRQISESPCREGETWGWDRRGIWVDRGCRAEFAIGRER